MNENPSQDTQASSAPHRVPAADSAPRGHFLGGWPETAALLATQTRMPWNMAPWLAVAAAALVAHFFLVDSPTSNFSVLALAAAVAAFLTLISFLLRRATERQPKETRDITISLDEEAIVWTDARGQSTRVPWSAMVGFREVRDHLLIDFGPQRLGMLPRRAWTPEDFMHVRAIVASRVARLGRNEQLAAATRRTLIMWIVLILMAVVVWNVMRDPVKRTPPLAPPASAGEP